jgi:hypothetical protein
MVAKKFCNAIFIVVIYYRIHEYTHKMARCTCYTSHFSTQSPSASTAFRQRETRACIPVLYHSESWTRSHFFNNLVIAPKPFPTDGIFEGSKEVEI